jgi:putative acetyltransferase
MPKTRRSRDGARVDVTRVTGISATQAYARRHSVSPGPRIMTIIIRPEIPADIDPIDALTRTAFRDHPHSRQTEQFIVLALRTAGALAVSLVAAEDGQVVGHIAFSPVSIADGAAGWYGIGPLSVAPERQRRGIGSRLVQVGLERLRALGAQGCVLVGEPAYYGRFGFANDPALVLEGVPPEYFLALRLGDAPAGGAVVFHPAFAATA